MKLVKQKLASGLYKVVDKETGRILHPSISLEKSHKFIATALHLRSPKQKEMDKAKVLALHLAKSKPAKKQKK